VERPAGHSSDVAPRSFRVVRNAARFALDEAELERAHKDVQSKVHPDRFASAARPSGVSQCSGGTGQRGLSHAEISASRAAFLCERAGVPIDANINTSMPVEFLAQQMEWRERWTMPGLTGMRRASPRSPAKSTRCMGG